MRYLICGGRRFANRRLFKETMERLSVEVGEPNIIIHGCARGADAMASEWAVKKMVPELRCPADWNRWGRAAGSIRNGQMLDVGWPDVVVAFPGGTGTADMLRRARQAVEAGQSDLRVIEVSDTTGNAKESQRKT